MDPSWRRQHLPVPQGRVFPCSYQTLRLLNELENVMSKTAELEAETVAQKVEGVIEPQTHSVEPYISEQYAKGERDKLWRKVWLQAGRLEDIPEVGNYITYDILDDSLLIVRTTPDTVNAYYNVCSHRGRRLVDTPKGARNARGKRMKFVCGFH